MSLQRARERHGHTCLPAKSSNEEVRLVLERRVVSRRSAYESEHTERLCKMSASVATSE